MAKKLISELIYVISTEKDDDVRFKSREIEKAFKNIFQAQSEQTNFPETGDPAQPRILLKGESAFLGISKVSAQLNVLYKPDDGVDKVLEQISNHCREVYRGVVELRGENAIKESGIIVSVDYPSSKTQADIVADLSKHLSNISLPGKVVTFMLKVGYESADGFFVNYEPVYYDIREQIVAPHPGPQKVKIKVSDMKVVSAGYEIKVDINNKPAIKSNSGFDKSPEQLIKKFKDCFDHEVDKIMSFTG